MINKETPELQFSPATHQYWFEGRELLAVTHAFAKVGITAYDKVPFDLLEQARQKGDYVHEIAAYYGAGVLDESSIDPALGGYLEAIKKYYKERVKKVIAIEKSVYDLKFGYAGTFDLLYLNYSGDLCLDDYKTPLVAHKANRLQTAAYAYAYQKKSDTPINERNAVMLQFDGNYELDKHTNPLRRDFDDFLTVLKCAILKIQMKIK